MEKQSDACTSPLQLALDKEEAEEEIIYLPPAAQKVIDEFALRYSIENLFRSMM